ncbi:MAG: hypothetical protein GX129_01255 [Clostridiales bacterium]|jgi:uncharacterized membrane protein YkoI|nr:hypothetical protein [Clostridiales bacterium]
MKIKKFFSTPLKAFLSIVSLTAIVAALSTGAVYAASAIAQNSSIGAENTEYEYEINANTGAIFSKSKETQNAQKSADSTAVQPTKSVSKKNTTNANQNKVDSKNNAAKPVTNKQQVATNQITLDVAKAKALADAGATPSSVTYTQAELDYDDGIAVYDIEFYTSKNEYEYEINATSGKVHDKSATMLENNTGNKQGRTDESKSKDNSSTYIGLDKAKAIAVNHAGFSISDVTFSKAKLDTDDGNTVYEIEFYKDGIEYEYKMDASSGNILEYDTEQAD